MKPLNSGPVIIFCIDQECLRVSLHAIRSNRRECSFPHWRSRTYPLIKAYDQMWRNIEKKAESSRLQKVLGHCLIQMYFV